MIEAKTVNELLDQAKFRENFKVMPQGDTFKDLSTVIIIPTRGTREEKGQLNCEKCGHKNEYTSTHVSGLHPIFVESYKRLIKPMNVPVIDMIVPGYEVGEAYNMAIQQILTSPALKDFKYVLTLEDDNIVPFIPDSQGALMMLYEDIEAGYDVAGGLYWTKGSPSMPLIYGDPKAKLKDKEGYFKVRFDWKEKPEGAIECNGMGMGFTLFKTDLFKDKRVQKAVGKKDGVFQFFKTVNENNEKGQQMYTQDLYFFEKIRALDYKVCVDTRAKIGHLDIKTGIIY